MTEKDGTILPIINMFAIFSAIVIVIIFIYVIISKASDRRFIKLKIRRSTSRREIKYWKRELRYLYICGIPVLGKYFQRMKDRND